MNFFNLFKSNITTIKSSTDRKKTVVDQLISRHSNGNINLQQAKYITTVILKEKQEKIFSYKFV